MLSTYGVLHEYKQTELLWWELSTQKVKWQAGKVNPGLLTLEIYKKIPKKKERKNLVYTYLLICNCMYICASYFCKKNELHRRKGKQNETRLVSFQ